MSQNELASAAFPVGGHVDREAPVRIVVIGAGPAAIMLLERLLASHRRDHPELRLAIQLVDPHSPGGGRIWRREQSPLLKLNSMLEDVAFFTDASSTIDGPVEPGPSLAEWVHLVRRGGIPRPEWRDAVLDHEIDTIADRDFPTRRLNNAYLSWCFGEVRRRASDAVTVTWRADVATAVTATDGPGSDVRTVMLASGEELEADLVIHALGHNGSLPSDEAARLSDFAARHGIDYVAPAFTADVDFDGIPAGHEVIVRGMGLAATDLVVLLAEGRGGRFERDADGRLTYLPSGREPLLAMGSRRGVPYRSKVTSVLAGSPVTLEYLGPALYERLAARDALLDFERDIWPLICAELLTGYYRELFTGYPDRVVGDWKEFRELLRDILAEDGGFASKALTRLIDERVPDPDDRFEITTFDLPLTGSGPREAGHPVASATGAAAVHERVTEHIRQDLRQRTSPEHSATQALFLTALFSYMSVAEIPVERWNAASRTRSLPKRWHAFFSYLASGPPGHRLEELLALAEAGIVRFLGGDIELSLDEHHGRFIAQGLALTAGGTAVSTSSATTLIDAWLPEAQAARSDNPLLRQLVSSGQAAEVAITDADHSGSTGQLVVGPDGSFPLDARQFGVGPFTSMQTAGAFTRPGIDSLPFRVHDRCARAVLDAAQALAAQRTAVIPVA